MAGLENILNKIIKDAEEKAQLIIKEAEEKKTYQKMILLAS